MHTRSIAVSLRLCAGVLLAVLALGCRDGGTGPEAKVHSVTITGVPAGPLLSGATVQLIANALNETGAAVSGARITWTSSDSSIARVSNAGLVTAVGAGPAVITAAAGSAKGSTTLDVRAGADLGPAGGTLSAPGGAAALTVPAGSLQQQTTFMLRPASAAPAHERMVPGTAWELGPEARSFGFAGATLALQYDASKVPAGVSPTSLQLYVLTNGAWTLLRGSTVDVAERRVSSRIGWTGTYAVIATPTDRVVLWGSLMGGALYAGQSGTLSAAALNTFGDTLRGRPITWSTSDASKATVDTTGKVTALAAGTVTITASNEGKSAGTTLTILARPTASWNQTADWTTFQGNARHSGEIAATLDPGAFKPLWTATVHASAALNPVTTGDGRVFTSTNSYFGSGSQKVVALNATTGSQVWSRDFGGIHSVHPPAYGGGRVYLTTGGHQDSFLWAFDGATGAVQFRSAYGNQWSRWFAPVVTSTSVIMAGGYYGGMYSFNAQNGSQNWFAATNQYDEWVPAVADGRVYAYTGSYTPKLSVVDAASGAELYSIADPNFSWNGWSMGVAPVLGSSNNVLVTQGGRLLSFDLAGRRIGWTQTGSFGGNVTLSDGVIYVFNNRQVEARKESDGSLLWVWIPPEGQPQRTMAVTRNILFVSTAANTYAVDLATRRHTWSYPAGGHISISRDGVLFIARADGKLSAVDLR